MTKDIWSILDSSFLGFESFKNDISEIFENNYKKNFPLYNLTETEKGKYKIEFALAGWNLDELNVYQSGNSLYVQSYNWGKPSSKIIEENLRNLEDYPRYLKKAISKSKFQSVFKLSDLTKVDEVYMENGLLTVLLTEKEPEKIEKTFNFEIKKK